MNRFAKTGGWGVVAKFGTKNTTATVFDKHMEQSLPIRENIK